MLLSEIGGKISEICWKSEAKQPQICRKSEANTPPNFGEMDFWAQTAMTQRSNQNSKKRHKIPSPLAEKRRAACQPRAPPAPSPEPLYLTHFNHRQKLYQMNLALDAAGLFYQAIGKFQIVVHPPFRRTLDVACIDIKTSA